MDDRICEGKFFEWYEFLNNFSKNNKKSSGKSIPEELADETFFANRIATSGRYQDSYRDICEYWTLSDIIRGLKWIKMYEDAEEEQMKKIQAESNRARK